MGKNLRRGKSRRCRPVTRGRAEYAVVSDDPSIIERDEVFDPIDALHAYFERNERRLRMAYQRTETLDEARKRYEAANPEEPTPMPPRAMPERGSADLCRVISFIGESGMDEYRGNSSFFPR